MRSFFGTREKMAEIYLILGLVAVIGGVLFLFMDYRWRKTVENLQSDQTSRALWTFMQQQMEHVRTQVSDGLDKNVALLTDQMRVINEQVHQQLSLVHQQLQSTSGQIGQRLEHTARVIGEVKENIGRLSKASDQIFEVGKNIAGLQEILRPPKLRGGIGEQFLGELLSQILPSEFFSLQYAFMSGERVDAVIRLGERLVPVDSKFPLDNFRRMIESQTEEEQKAWRKVFLRDVRKHIDDIASKYIVPREGTYDFALLYIPAENVYYETITKDEAPGEEKGILSHAMKQRVIPVSPNSFYAYLQVIILGLKGLKIEEHAQEIQTLLAGMAKDLKTFQEDFRLVGKHITDAKNRYDESRARIERFSIELERIEREPSTPAPTSPSPLPAGEGE